MLSSVFKFSLCLALCDFLVLIDGRIEYVFLDGNAWILKGGSHNLSATVPGGVYSDLMRANLIGDVFYRNNDIETRWVSKENWIYSLEFTVPKSFLKDSNIVTLVFDGVDTFSTIYLNDARVGVTDNMFVRYEFDVKQHVKEGANKLEVRFESPVNVAKRLYDEQSKNYEVVPTCVPKDYNGECHANHVRKMQASFSWDWGPALPSVGIWKSAYLKGYNRTAITDITIATESKDQNNWNLRIKFYLPQDYQGETAVQITTQLFLTHKKFLKYDKLLTKSDRIDKEYYEVNMVVQKSFVNLWWPNGYGEPRLYSLSLTFRDIINEDVFVSHRKIGFRTVELIEDPIPTGGREFYFKVNGVPIFAKGTNSIPINILPELGQRQDTIKFLLESAKEAHMNMIRVWGGGTYEDDYFYELADELGIMIWQDFMFACSMYPATDEFLENVRQEVRDQVRRLHYHPSIVLWAGNNENEAALRQNWYGTALNFQRFKDDYVKLYVDTIREEVALNDNTRPYLTSSPTNGVQSAEEGHVAQNPQDTLYGDIHFYNYINDAWNTSTYRITRFSSEYGYQSLPMMESLRTATDNKDDLKWGSEFLSNRQHHPMGYSEMLRLINYRLKLEELEDDFFEKFVYYCQIIQAMAVKVETEFYRQWRSLLNEKGEGHTMGALYWQLNDVWIGPTWAGIDFTGRWKMLHYYAKDFFSPVIVTGDQTPDGNLNVYVVSDLLKALPKTNITLGVYNWNSLLPVYQETINVDIAAAKSALVKTYDIEDFLTKIPNKPCGDKPKNNCFFHFVSEGLTPDNFAFPAPLKFAPIQNANIQIASITGQPGHEFVITLTTDRPALFVWLDVPGIQGTFSENGFNLIQRTKSVTFKSKLYVSLYDVRESVSVIHLNNIRPVKIAPSGQNSIVSSFLVVFVGIAIALKGFL